MQHAGRVHGAFIGSTSLLIAHIIEKYRERVRHTNMTLTTTETQFLHIAQSALCGSQSSELSIDWSSLFAVANQQKLLPIIFESVRKTSAADENAELFGAIRRQVIAQVFNQTLRTEEFAGLYRQLRAAGLHPIVVKGQLCSRLYALKDHRISADDDLFVPDDEFIACHKLLCEAGMVTATPDEDIPGEDEISYTKPDSPLYIELHRRLFDSSETAHDDLNGFFDGIHSRAVEVDGLLAMPPHDHMLYLILHAYKHFVGCGIGLRQFCDIGLWARAYHDKIDWELLGAQCERVHAAVFAAAAFRIARECLGVDFELPERWQTDIDIEPMLHDTFEGGIYGSNDRTRLHSSTVTLNAVRSSRHGEKSSILRSVFPAKSYMERRYAYLKKHPALLPVAWVQRIAHYAEEKRGDNSAAGSVRLAKKRIGLMKMYGIME